MPEPLQKNHLNGLPYVRRPEIERIIDANANLNRAALIQRFIIIDRQSPYYLPSECLVHFIRDAERRGDVRLRNKLMPMLLNRCNAVLQSKLNPKILRHVIETREDILI